jgi:hypothetical protein
VALRTAQPPVDPARRVAGAAREVERLAQLERVVGELAARADADDRPDVVQSILSAAEAAQLVGRVAELERTVQGRLVDAPDASLDARHVAGGDPAAVRPAHSAARVLAPAAERRPCRGRWRRWPTQLRRRRRRSSDGYRYAGAPATVAARAPADDCAVCGV